MRRMIPWVLGQVKKTLSTLNMREKQTIYEKNTMVQPGSFEENR
jgi:hypothetical protein